MLASKHFGVEPENLREVDSDVGNWTAWRCANFIALFTQRLCPDLYHAKLQTAMGLNCSIPPHHSGAPFENGTDSMLMMTDEGDGPFVNGVETLRRSNGHATPQDVVTLGASHLPPNHTCCSTRAQLCTMSLQQVRQTHQHFC